ncbi:GerAB/ArcD/ProY family transporter [Paenibacillus gallinarum]|uniref:GerAB/ArcD/ProY family transporter n=1 Tax=Paenibacillus gallinarum TaxID=2762232 RepID=A0ABR8SYB7_9BACL|nr:GerAB/ArcD/ProY family transporter [Paenibacillus gallinarum]MBD7968497.1 GerAB/ArcD/ProY family transporter [Paenibacillus gallinarum]
MKINVYPPKNMMLHAYLLFFIIINTQVGVGIFTFQRVVYEASMRDAWISVIVAGLVTHLIMWLIVRTLQKYKSADLFGIHYDLYGKWIGMVFNLLYIVYYFLVTFAVMRNYSSVVQAWIFPDIPTWVLILLISCLAFYAAMGGIRVIVGICLFSFIVTLLTVLLFHSSIQHAIWTQLLPVLDSSSWDIMNGAVRMGFSLAGFEIISVIYPFILNKNRVMLHSQLAVLFSNVLYLFIMVISIGYFAPDQLLRSLWPSLNMLKIVEYPYLERLEFIVISAWMLVILSGILLNTWLITRGCKRMWKLNPKPVLIAVFFIILLMSFVFHKRLEVKDFMIRLEVSSIFFSFIYPALLCCIVFIVFAWRKKKQRKGGEHT